MHHNFLSRAVYNRTTDLFTPCFMTLSYDITKQVTCIRVLSSVQETTHWSVALLMPRTIGLSTHTKRPTWVTVCDRIKFSKIFRSAVTVFSVSLKFSIEIGIFYYPQSNAAEKQKTAAERFQITRLKRRYLFRFKY